MNQNDDRRAPRHLRSLLWAFVAAAALVAGCGGGGSDGASSPAPAPVPPGAGELSTCGLADFSGRILQRINQLRASGATCGSTPFAPAPAVAWNALLTRAADGHSQDMAARNYFDHTSPDGRTYDQRISATGYAWSTVGENIAAGYPSVDAVMDGWTQSAGHCANLMNPNFTEIGVACVPGTSSNTYGNYWTMDLAKPL